jgi:uncharacterized protein (TIGR00156 family)
MDQELHMARHHFLGGAAIVLALGSATAVAQYQGPGASKFALAQTVAEVLKDPTDDRPVVLTGTLVSQTGRESFVFRDATGEIQVEIDREDFPGGQPVGAETQVVIRGEVDARLMRKPRVDVERLQLATATP